MRFRISAIDTKDFSGKIKTRRDNKNLITLITGINGTGKSRLLASMHRHFDENFRYLPSGHSSHQPHFKSNTSPKRIITQTFSPFSKFPAPRNHRNKEGLNTPIGQLLNSELSEELYIPIGFYRSMGIYSSGIVKRVIEDALIYICKDRSRRYEPVAKAFHDLGYESKLKVGFTTAHFHSIDNDIFFNSISATKKIVTKIISELKSNSGPSTGVVRVLAKEISLSGSKKIIDGLVEAIKVVSAHLKSIKFEPRSKVFWTEIDFQNLTASNQEIIRSSLLLRRCGFLNIDDFFVHKIEKKISNISDEVTGPDSNSVAIDMDDLSSGQLQIIGTILSLSTMIEDNSLILIDEPELSLHPRWQLDWLDILTACIARYEGCHIFVATHSPLIVSAAYARKLQVVSLDTLVEDERKMSNSVSVEEALTQVFSTPAPNSSYLSSTLFEAISLANAGLSERQEMRKKLENLSAIYESDKLAKNLIKDALNLLND